VFKHKNILQSFEGHSCSVELNHQDKK